MTKDNDTNIQSNSNVVKLRNTHPVRTFFSFILLLLLISAIILFTLLKSSGYDFKSMSVQEAFSYLTNQAKSSDQHEIITFSIDGSGDYKLFKNYIVLASKDGVKWYDKSGKLLQEKAMTLIQPVLKIAGSYLVVADVGGRDVYVYKDKTLLWSKKLDDEIISVNISEWGISSIVMQSKEFKTSVQVFDENGVDKYTKMCAEDIVLSAMVLKSGEDVVINKLSTDGIKTGTTLEFLNIYEEKPIATIEINEQITPILFSTGKTQVAVGTNVIVAADEKGKELWRKSASLIYCTAPETSKYIVYAGALITNGKETHKVITVNSAGETVYSFDINEKILGMHLYGDRVALRTQRSIYLYTLKGQKVSEYHSPNEIQDVYLIGKKQIVLMHGGSISVMNMD